MLTAEMTDYLAGVLAEARDDVGAVLSECARELPQGRPVPARQLRQRYPVSTDREHLWSPSYLAASCGTPLSIIRAYVENQRRPD